MSPSKPARAPRGFGFSGGGLKRESDFLGGFSKTRDYCVPIEAPRGNRRSELLDLLHGSIDDTIIGLARDFERQQAPALGISITSRK